MGDWDPDSPGGPLCYTGRMGTKNGISDDGKTHARILQKLDRVIELMEAQAKITSIGESLRQTPACPDCGIRFGHQGTCPRFVDPVLRRAPCTGCGSLFDHHPGCERDSIQSVTRESEV